MMKKFSLTSFAAGITFGVLLAGAWFLGGYSALVPAGEMPQPAASAATNTSQKSGAISVNDQSAGTAVAVESVTVPAPGVWVAVRDVSGRDLGNVLGAVRVTGPRSQVSVPLLRATEAGHTYAVELYRVDNTDRFDPATNSVYVDFNTGARVVAYFVTTE